MKIGGEKKGEVIALVVLMLVAVGMLWRTLGAGGGAAPGLAPAATAAPSGATSGPGATAAAVSLDPRLHMDELDRLRAIDYTGSGRDLFHFGSAPAIVQKPSPAAMAAAARAAAAVPARPSGPPTPPPPPPIPLKFYGVAQSDGAPEQIFLQLGDESYVVATGDTIEHRYLIETIGKVSVRVKDLQTQSEQELPLQQG